MASLGEQLKRFSEKTKLDMATVVRKTAFSLGESMVVMSPVLPSIFRIHAFDISAIYKLPEASTPKPAG